MTVDRTLYYANGSIPSWRVLLALHEKAIAFTPRRLRLMGAVRETRTPEFLQINPRGQTPVLVDGDVTLHESFAILHYLELVHPAPPLLPPAGDRAGLARALCRAHEAESFACAYEPLEQLFVMPGRMSAAQRDSLAAALAAIDRDLEHWEARAGEATFIAGEALTLADCCFYPTLAYMLRRGLSLAGRPGLDAYRSRMQARAAAVLSHPEGWEIDRVGKVDLFARARAAVEG